MHARRPWSEAECSAPITANDSDELVEGPAIGVWWALAFAALVAVSFGYLQTGLCAIIVGLGIVVFDQQKELWLIRRELRDFGVPRSQR